MAREVLIPLALSCQEEGNLEGKGNWEGAFAVFFVFALRPQVPPAPNTVTGP